MTFKFQFVYAWKCPKWSMTARWAQAYWITTTRNKYIYLYIYYMICFDLLFIRIYFWTSVIMMEVSPNTTFKLWHNQSDAINQHNWTETTIDWESPAQTSSSSSLSISSLSSKFVLYISRLTCATQTSRSRIIQRIFLWLDKFSLRFSICAVKILLTVCVCVCVLSCDLRVS